VGATEEPLPWTRNGGADTAKGGST
jgi:hypothetical protein